LHIFDLWHGAKSYGRQTAQLQRNVRLFFLAAILSGTSQGIFRVVFNLYILQLGIGADVLGRILSAGPFAQAVGSIPIGFLAEIIGYKKALLLIYGFTGISQLAQVSTGNPSLVFLAAFAGGLAFAGDFVVRLPFLALNTTPAERKHVFSTSSILYAVSGALGALFAGYAPNLLRPLAPDLSIAYRYTLYGAGVLTLASLLPLLMLRDGRPERKGPISLQPYLLGMDRFTVQQAVVSLFVGLSMGLVTPFLNVFFVYHLGTSREFFSSISALTVIPSTLATALGPFVAGLTGTISAIAGMRSIMPLGVVALALTASPLVGAGAVWFYQALLSTSQPLSFAFAMEAAKAKAKVAASAWLNVTFWLGGAIAAPITGLFLARSEYRMPLYLSGAAALLAGVLTLVFFISFDGRHAGKEELDGASDISAR